MQADPPGKRWPTSTLDKVRDKALKLIRDALNKCKTESGNDVLGKVPDGLFWKKLVEMAIRDLRETEDTVDSLFDQLKNLSQSEDRSQDVNYESETASSANDDARKAEVGNGFGEHRDRGAEKATPLENWHAQRLDLAIPLATLVLIHYRLDDLRGLHPVDRHCDERESDFQKYGITFKEASLLLKKIEWAFRRYGQ